MTANSKSEQLYTATQYFSLKNISQSYNIFLWKLKISTFVTQRCCGICFINCTVSYLQAKNSDSEENFSLGFVMVEASGSCLPGGGSVAHLGGAPGSVAPAGRGSDLLHQVLLARTRRQKFQHNSQVHNHRHLESAIPNKMF